MELLNAKSQAIGKIEKEWKAYRGDPYGQIMKDYIAVVLKDLCRQNEEFAQAVIQGGNFDGCMKAVRGKIKGEGISDLDACRAAAEYYFPGSVVEFQMQIHMSKFEAEDATDTTEETGGGILLRLEDFL